MKNNILVAVDMRFCMEALDCLRRVGNVDYEYPFSRDVVLSNLKKYDAYLGHTDIRVDREFLAHANGLKVVGTCSTGTDHIDKDALRDRKIHLLSLTTEYELLDTFTSTAEMAWGLLLSCLRRIPFHFERAKRGEIGPKDHVTESHQLRGKTLGIVGLGRLGRMVAEYGKAFQMRVIANDIKPVRIDGVERVDFDTLLRESDVISLHVHLNENTRHLMNRETFAKMKPDSVLVNTARGDLVDEAALLEALESGKLLAAGLDVIHNEWDSDISRRPLMQYAQTHHNLIVTPHIGGASFESVVEARKFMARKMADFLTEK
ncbi:MAG: hydroxyacid dehydrogenase [Phycisphaerae bacterium]|nr:hydroxyacid dehydrogenase [Phycisphaerae bacterium]